MPRRILKLSVTVCVVFLHVACANDTTAASWFEHSLVGIEVGPTGAQFGYSDTNDARYCARFDGREIVRRAVAAHCEYVVLWARDGDYAYYDSKLLPKAPGLGARDPLRDAVDEARQHRFEISDFSGRAAAGHTVPPR